MGPIELRRGRAGNGHPPLAPGRGRGPDWPEETAIAITFRDGKVVAMQDSSPTPAEL